MNEEQKEKLFRYWEEHDHESMINFLSQYLERTYPDAEDEEQIIQLLNDVESGLPPRIVSEAVGTDIRTARQYRWHRGRRVVNRRRTKRKSVPPSKRQEIRERDGGCARCGISEEEAEDGLTLHHIIPHTHGGVNIDENMAMLCDSCHKKSHLGDYSSRQLAYDTIDEFWQRFCHPE